MGSVVVTRKYTDAFVSYTHVECAYDCEAVSPIEVLYVPLLHAMHFPTDVAPVSVPYVPAEHGVCVESPVVAQLLPMGQVTAAVTPVGQ